MFVFIVIILTNGEDCTHSPFYICSVLCFEELLLEPQLKCTLVDILYIQMNKQQNDCIRIGPDRACPLYFTLPQLLLLPVLPLLCVAVEDSIDVGIVLYILYDVLYDRLLAFKVVLQGYFKVSR